jgi:hypothetical protein
MRRSLVLLSVGFAIFAALSASAFAGGAGDTFAEGRAHGEYAIAQAAGEVSHPSAIFVRVKSIPHQKVSGAWTVVCAKGYGAGTKSGRVSGYTNFTTPLKLPYNNPSSCIASANAQLSSGGLVKVKLLSR